MSAWMALRRPLLQAFVMGCAASLMTSGRLTWRLALPATIYWMFVPLCEIASLAVVTRRAKMPLARLIDPFLASATGWLLLMLVFAGAWALAPPLVVWSWSWMTAKQTWLIAGGLVFAWSAYADFRFFRSVLGRTPAHAALDLAAQRLLCWGMAFTIFVAPGGWQTVASWLGI